MRPAAPAEPVPSRPALAPWYRQVADGDRLLLEHAGTVVTLEGRAATVLMPALLALLDGTRTVEELVTALGREAEPAIANALDVLGRHGLLVEGDGAAPHPPGSSGAGEAALFAAAQRRTSPGKAREALAGARTSVAGGGRSGSEVARLLVDAGVGDVRTVSLELARGDDDLLIATPGAEELDALVSLNERFLGTATPWLQALPTDGRIVVIGPLFLPGHTACHACYQLRRGACSNYEADYERVATAPARAPFPLALVAATAGLAATLAIRWLATRDPALPGRFYALETGPVLALSCHNVLRVPRCPACSPADRAMPAPWYRETTHADRAR